MNKGIELKGAIATVKTLKMKPRYPYPGLQIGIELWDGNKLLATRKDGRVRDGGRCIDCGCACSVYDVGKMAKTYCGCNEKFHRWGDTGKIKITVKEFMEL